MQQEKTTRMIYTGCSMLRVFSPGDYLDVAPISFEDVCCGDVIVFRRSEGHGIVHRVIRRTPEALVTMGDNNPDADALPVTAGMELSLVVRRNPVKGSSERVSRGRRGMLEFWLHRLERRVTLFSGKVGHRLLPMMFWRRTLKTCLKQGDSDYFLYKNRVVARRMKSGVVCYFPRLNILLFKVPPAQQDDVRQ